MFRITRLAEDTHSISLKLEGWLVGQWGHELRTECERALADKRTVLLDLSGVMFADQAGINTLRALRRNRVQLTSYSLFIAGLLEQRACEDKDERRTRHRHE